MNVGLIKKERKTYFKSFQSRVHITCWIYLNYNSVNSSSCPNQLPVDVAMQCNSHRKWVNSVKSEGNKTPSNQSTLATAWQHCNILNILNTLITAQACTVSLLKPSLLSNGGKEHTHTQASAGRVLYITRKNNNARNYVQSRHELLPCDCLLCVWM